jgi:hypothetical protein
LGKGDDLAHMEILEQKTTQKNCYVDAKARVNFLRLDASRYYAGARLAIFEVYNRESNCFLPLSKNKSLHKWIRPNTPTDNLFDLHSGDFNTIGPTPFQA